MKLIAFAAVALILPSLAAADEEDVDCPYTCPAQAPVDVAVGGLPAGITLDVVPLAPTSGQAHIIDGGICVQCPNKDSTCVLIITVEYDAPDGSPNSLVYNDCGVLTGYAAKVVRLTPVCGQTKNVKFEVGQTHPNFDPSDCESNPAWAGGNQPVLTRDISFTCGNCDN